MVKSPKISHSKSITEPVTIELGAGDISRIPAESDAAGAGPGKPDGGPREASPGGKADPEPAAAAARTPQAGKDDKPEAAATGSAAPGGSRFGRDAGAGSPPPSPPSPAGKDAPAPRGGSGGALLAGIAGALIALAGAGGGAWYAGLLSPSTQLASVPSDEIATLQGEIAALHASLSELQANAAAPAQDGDASALSDVNGRIEGLATSVEDLRGQVAKLGEAPGPGAEGGAIDDLRAGLTALEQKVSALPAGDGMAAEAVAALTPEIARLDAGVKAASDAAAMASDAARQAAARADEIGKALESLSATVAEQDKAPAIALAIAASSLKAAVERGTSFATELDTYASLAPDAPEIAALRELAAGGVPSRAEIARGMNDAADAMVQAGRTVDTNAGFFERLWQSAQSLIKVRPVGEIEGTGVPAVVARIEAAVMAGDYGKAVAEYDALPADAKAAGVAFMDKVRVRLAADEAVDKALAAALRA